MSVVPRAQVFRSAALRRSLSDVGDMSLKIDDLRSAEDERSIGVTNSGSKPLACKAPLEYFTVDPKTGTIAHRSYRRISTLTCHERSLAKTITWVEACYDRFKPADATD